MSNKYRFIWINVYYKRNGMLNLKLTNVKINTIGESNVKNNTCGFCLYKNISQYKKKVIHKIICVCVCVVFKVFLFNAL